jgi:hypothetical protein
LEGLLRQRPAHDDRDYRVEIFVGVVRVIVKAESASEVLMGLANKRRQVVVLAV